MEPSISQMILKIYQTVDQCPSSQLKEALFGTLQDSFDFDCGNWVVGRLHTDSFEVYSACAYEIPAHKLAASTTSLSNDAASQALVSTPGITLNLNENYLAENQACASFLQQLDASFALTTMIKRSGFTDVSVISLYRNNGRSAFTEDERSAIETITPHLVQAYHLGAQIKQGQEWNVDQHWAIVDNDNYIRYCSDQFREFLSNEAGERVEQTLPSMLVKAMQQRTPHIGSLGVERRSLSGNAEFITLVERGVLSQLTPSEKRVVEHYARGLSYKKVAQQLDISHHTVIKHVNNVYRKLNINNKNQLIELVAHVLS